MGNFGYKDFGHVNLDGVFRPEQLFKARIFCERVCDLCGAPRMFRNIPLEKDCSTIVQPDWQHFMIIFLLFFLATQIIKTHQCHHCLI